MLNRFFYEIVNRFLRFFYRDDLNRTGFCRQFITFDDDWSGNFFDLS
jgi:hypothetical protein